MNPQQQTDQNKPETTSQKIKPLIVQMTTELTTSHPNNVPEFLLHYIQGPIIAIMQAVNRSKDTFTSTLIGMIGKIIIIIVLSYLNFGIYSLIFSIIFNIIFVTLFNLVKIKNIFN